MMFRLALASLWARKFTVGVCVLSIALATALFLSVEKTRLGARASFSDTISGTDLIMGARGGSIQLLLYSVFRIGEATNNLSWESYQEIATRDEVDWIVPISLGDSHYQFRVMGTQNGFFEHYHYRGSQSLEWQSGQSLNDLYDAVIGADVAKRLGYEIGDAIVVTHGISSFSKHDDQPFRVVGILKKTRTPVDRTVIVGLDAIEAIHVDWSSGAQTQEITPQEVIRNMDLTPKAITAALIGTKSRMQVFDLQRAINEYDKEPLSAILPGVALAQLWRIVGVAENALLSVSVMVVVVSVLGMMIMIFSSLNERRREMAIWRSVGATPMTIMGLMGIEALFMGLMGAALGVMLAYFGLALLRPWVDQTYGIWLPVKWPNAREWVFIACIVFGAGLAGLLPAWRAQRLSLADGMMVKI